TPKSVSPAPFEGPDAHDRDVDAPGMGAADLQGERLAFHLDLDAMQHAGALAGTAGGKLGQALVVLDRIDPAAVRQGDLIAAGGQALDRDEATKPAVAAAAGRQEID